MVDDAEALRSAVQMATEIKDLAKTLVGIYTGTFAFIVVFSEKVIDIKHATKGAKNCMLICWSLMFIATLTGLSSISLSSTLLGVTTGTFRAQTIALMDKWVFLYFITGQVIASANILFGGGLMFLLIVAIKTLRSEGKE